MVRQLNYKPKLINGVKKILFWIQSKERQFKKRQNPNSIFHVLKCQVTQCEISYNKNDNETADLIHFSVTPSSIANFYFQCLKHQIISHFMSFSVSYMYTEKVRKFCLTDFKKNNCRYHKKS